MRAVLCKAWGAPEDLVVEQVAAPVPGEGEVRIRVAAAGVNFADTLIIAGKYQARPDFPFSPGLEVAGTVIECGPGVARLAPGDRVMAAIDAGGFAEEAVARAGDVHRIPEAMDFTTAAGFPVAYGTGYGALSWRAGLQSGETLLVLGAAGGAGLTAVECGKAMGARVIAAAGGAAKLAVAREHGADETIDYRSEDLRERVKALTGGAGCDVIYDPVGGDAFDTALRCIAWEGRIVVIGFASGRIPQIPANILLVKNCSAVGYFWGSYRRHDPARVRAGFERLLAWYEEGRLRPLVSAHFPLEGVAGALRSLMERRSTGKVVLTTGTA
jgi:NADPH2:quinone reductase